MKILIYILFLCFTLGVSSEEKYFILNKVDVDGNESPEHEQTYKPTWDSLDGRPLPSWYDENKIGIFIHWGVFSVPSFGSEWFWNNWQEEKQSTKYHDFMRTRYPPNFTYQDFARDFTAEFFNASEWSEIFQASGAKYVVLTSKHHEGYTLWPSKYSFSWNSMDVGPHQDLIGKLAGAIRNETNLKFGLYHSLYEWYNPLWLSDKANNFTTNTFVTNKIMPELRELIMKYKPEIVWSDGDWEAPDRYWQSKEFLSWLFNESPVKETVVVNDRWGANIACHHGDFYTCTDRYNPGVLVPHKWENCMTLDKKSWGYRREAKLSDYFTLKELVEELVITVSCGGNLLMNVGPTKDGIILPIFEDRLRGLGSWLSVNGEGIYNTKPWIAQNDTLTGSVWYTQSSLNEKIIYALMVNWPDHEILRLGSINVEKGSRVTLLGYHNDIKWKTGRNITEIELPLQAEKGQPAWVIKIERNS